MSEQPRMVWMKDRRDQRTARLDATTLWVRATGAETLPSGSVVGDTARDDVTRLYVVAPSGGGWLATLLDSDARVRGRGEATTPWGAVLAAWRSEDSPVPIPAC